MEKRSLKKNDFDIKEWYLSRFRDFENSLNGDREMPFHKVRRKAISSFSELGFPTTRVEEWKYTSLKPLLKHEFGLVDKPADIPAEAIRQFTFPDLKASLLVFINGRFSADHSRIPGTQKGVILESLKDAFRDHRELLQKYLSSETDYREETFTALNTAFTLEGAFIYVPDNTVLETPVHILNIATRDASAYQSHPRNVIVAGKNSQLKFIESHHHQAETVYLHNAVSEIFIDEQALVDHVKIQDESGEAFRIATTQVKQQKNSFYNSVSIDLGGRLVRNSVNIHLDGEYCETNLYGFYLVTGNQHIDNHTNIEHAKPNCLSNELFKGILGGKSRGVFSGTIYVRPDAQKTNAFQSNKNLLLSDDAEIDSKPQLKIFADDVRCTHGATIGQLDKEALFYLRQRGIQEADAQRMLRYAFAADVFNNIKLESVRERVDEMIHDKFQKEI